jgi:hypothetical protein
MTQRVVGRHSFLDEPLLNITRKIRPQPQCSLSNNICKSSGVAGPAFVLRGPQAMIERRDQLQRLKALGPSFVTTRKNGKAHAARPI